MTLNITKNIGEATEYRPNYFHIWHKWLAPQSEQTRLVIPSYSAVTLLFRWAWRNLLIKCVFIVVYAHFFLSDLKKVSYSNMHISFYAHFFILCASWHFHPGFFYAIFQNAHKNRWMETQLVTALKYGTKMFQKFITCLFDNSYISYMGLCICFILF